MIDEQGDFVVLTSDDASVADAGKRAVQIIAANPKISKAELGKKLGVDRHRLEEIVANESWQWRATSRTTGFFVSKGSDGTLMPFTESQ